MSQPRTVKLGDLSVSLQGTLPEVGSAAPDFALVADSLEGRSLSDYAGKAKVVSVFPSVDTPTCAVAARAFNGRASSLGDAVVLCVSKDLPFASSRFCAAEGLENVTFLSAFRDGDFAGNYGVGIADGPLAGLLARAVFVLDRDNRVVHAQLVGDIKQEPDYDAALEALKGIAA